MTELRTIDVTELTRVEGEGALKVALEGDQIKTLEFNIFESPRFFEAFLRNRSYMEVPDITARICGICPVAYQTSSANAIEDALKIQVSPEIRDMRRLLYMGEYIESHALHVYLLHAPDFLGYPSGIAMAADFPNEVKDALRLKKIGNAMMTLVGGREIHPINPRVGGFWKAISKADLRAMIPDLEWALDAAIATTKLVATFNFPDLDPDYEFVAIHDPAEYAVIDGTIKSTRGIDAPLSQWGEIFEEEHVGRTNALHCRTKARGSYQVGPTARVNINFEQLHPKALQVASEVGIRPPVTNPFKSIITRSIEMVHAAATMLDIIDSYTPPAPPYVEATEESGEGFGASEAPRGTLFHHYRINQGLVETAQIVPPTSQNQLRIEEDLRQLIPTQLHLDDKALGHVLEQAIRNYDPCISCATHFVDLQIDRG